MAKSTGAFACQSDATLVTGRQDSDVTGVSDQWVDGEAMSDHNHKCQPSLFKCTQSRGDYLKGHIDSCHLLHLSSQSLSDAMASLDHTERSHLQQKKPDI